MDIAKERGLCRMIVINKFDAPDVDLEQLLLDLQEVWGPGVSRSTFPPTTAPSSSTASTRTKEKPTFSASVKSIAPSLKRSSSRTTKCSSTISRKAASTPRTLHPLITKALREGTVIPVCFVSAKNLIGIRDFMKVIIRHLPSPAEANDALFIHADGTPFITRPEKDLPSSPRSSSRQ